MYVLNYLVKRGMARGRKIVTTFVNLRTVFDSIDRGILGRSLVERGVSEELRERIMGVYEEMRSVVREEDRVGKKFWTEKGQGCPLSPMLFNFIIADIEKGLGKDDVGGVRLGEKKLKVLGYADDLMILTEKEEDMRWLLRRLETFG